jgi:hypothetical protein
MILSLLSTNNGRSPTIGTASIRDCGANFCTPRRSPLDILSTFATQPQPPQTPPMPRSAVQLGVLRAQLADQNAAEVQACVPLVSLKGDSYRLKDRDLGPRPGRPSTDIA